MDMAASHRRLRDVLDRQLEHAPDVIILLEDLTAVARREERSLVSRALLEVCEGHLTQRPCELERKVPFGSARVLGRGVDPQAVRGGAGSDACHPFNVRLELARE